MKTIIEGNKAIIKLLGSQNCKADSYRLMKYVLATECEDGILLHNVITGRMVLLSDEEKQLINATSTEYNEQMDDLINGLFLVADRYDERDTVYKLRKILERLFMPRAVESYVILPTTNCNAKCYYCFENNLLPLSMSSETSEKLVEYIVNHNGKRKVHLEWFGGEPLLGVNVISRICGMLSDRGVDYFSTMISNGYLFVPDLIKKAINNWKLNKVQITLDGTEEVYNNVKAYKNVKGSAFKIVMRNIYNLLAANIQVIIRLNLDQHNYEDLKTLSCLLGEKFSHFSNFQVYVQAVQKDAGYAPLSRSLSAEQKLYLEQVELSEWVKALGLSKSDSILPSLNFVRCVSDNPGMVVVYPDGRLYKCENVIEAENIGSIYTERIDIKIKDIYKERTEMEECKTCPLFPKCILLKRCPANESYNRITCNYDVNCYKKIMLYNYELAKK